MSEISINKDVETRIIKAINHIEPDRVPIWEALENPTLYNHFAPGKTAFLTAASITCEALGIDMTYGCMNPPLPDWERGGAIKYYAFSVILQSLKGLLR